MGPVPTRKQKSIKRFGFLLALFSTVLFFPSRSEAHPFHASSMEMEWNEKTNAFEVSVQLDPNDLEQELRRFSKKKIVLEELSSDEIDSSNLVFRYLTSAFAASYNGQQLKVKPIGFEVETKSAWIYFELPVAINEVHTKLDNLKITNKLLINQHAQTNNFLLKYKQQRLSTTFHEKRTNALIRRDDSIDKLQIVKNNVDD